MLKNVKFAVWTVSGYLLAYCLLLGFGNGFWRAFAVGMYLASPVLVVWLAYTIVRHGGRNVPELGEDAEFGYGDRDTGTLGAW
jgi:hypothetical protein